MNGDDLLPPDEPANFGLRPNGPDGDRPDGVDGERDHAAGTADAEAADGAKQGSVRGSRDGSKPGAMTAGARAGAVAALSVLVVLSGTLLGRAGTKPPPAGPAGQGVYSGAAFCPHGGGADWKGWLAVVNPTSRPVSVRTTTFAGTAVRLTRTFTLAPKHEVYREIPVSDPSSATEVEYFGGPVAAGAIVRSSGTNADVEAERCIDTVGADSYLPDETTAADEHTSAIVMNPFATPAEFNVVIRTNQRAVRPGPLTPAVLRPNSAIAIPIDPWAREGAGETAVTVQIQSVIGRVVAGSLVVSPRGVRAEAGLPVASGGAIIPASGYHGGSLEVLNPGDRRASMTIVAEGPSGPRAIPAGSAGPIVGPGSARSFDLGDQTDAGIHVDAGSGRVAAMLKLSGPNGGEATLSGWFELGARWAVPPTLPPTGGTARLALENPDPTAATVSIQWISPAGPVKGGPKIAHVGPNRTVTIDMPRSDVPLFALVTSLKGSILPAETSDSLAGTAFAATSGIPIS